MRFTQIRTTEQADLQALRRIRDQPVSSRMRLINQVRAFCLQYGAAIRQGAGVFRLDLPRVLADETNDLMPAMRRILVGLFEDPARIAQRIAWVTREIEGLAARDDRARRLMTIPGYWAAGGNGAARCGW
jgi:transposase